MYKINGREHNKTIFLIAFLILFLVSIALNLLDFSLWIKVPVELAFFLLVYSVFSATYGNKGEAETRKAKDRVSMAVIGLLHSTNGISSLQTYNSLIRDNLDQKEKVLEILDNEKIIIDEYASKVKSIVADLSESFRTERERTDVGRLTGRSVEFIRLKRIRDKKVPLSLILSDQPVYAAVYPSILKNAIENIIENSYNELLEEDIPHGQIKVTVEKSKKTVSIFIEDNGKGFNGIEGEISPEFLKPGRSRRKNGNGLGLYVAVQAVKECGGTVKIFSRKDGMKTVIALPEIE
ncbi:MAG: sensor histidine kinase [Spirochaetales bacterium]|nr:sensor histidine kinase [Spirochaetales bacterium]